MDKTALKEDSQVFGTIVRLEVDIKLLEETILEMEIAMAPVQVDDCPKGVDDGGDGKATVEEEFCPVADKINNASKWVRCLRQRIRANLDRVKL